MTDTTPAAAPRDIPLTHDFGDGNGPVPAHQHTNGGGWVADTATVASTAYVGPQAQVYGKAHVTDTAHVSGAARISGNSVVSGNARVSGCAHVTGNARVCAKACAYGNALVCEGAYIGGSAHVNGNARITGHAHINGDARVNGNTCINGDACVNGIVNGDARIDGDTYISGGTHVSRDIRADSGEVAAPLDLCAGRVFTKANPDVVTVTTPGGVSFAYDEKGNVTLLAGTLTVPGERDGIVMTAKAGAMPIVTVDLDKVDASAANAATLVRIDGVRKAKDGEGTEDVWAHITFTERTLAVRLAKRTADVVRRLAFIPWYKRAAS